MATHSSGKPMPSSLTKGDAPTDLATIAKRTAVVLGAGALFGAMGYGAYTTMTGQILGNVRAMGMRVGIQFGLFTAGLAYYGYATYGSPSEAYDRYKTTGRFGRNTQNPQSCMQRDS